MPMLTPPSTSGGVDGRPFTAWDMARDAPAEPTEGSEEETLAMLRAHVQHLKHENQQLHQDVLGLEVQNHRRDDILGTSAGSMGGPSVRRVIEDCRSGYPRERNRSPHMLRARVHSTTQ
eukprot:1479974-Pyramimonas_sp.AAC.2